MSSGYRIHKTKLFVNWPTGRAESIAYKRDTTSPAPLICYILTYTPLLLPNLFLSLGKAKVYHRPPLVLAGILFQFHLAASKIVSIFIA